jgi:hypothetical protein
LKSDSLAFIFLKTTANEFEALQAFVPSILKILGEIRRGQIHRVTG